MKYMLLILASVILTGCKSEDNSPRAATTKYLALDSAYVRCIGDYQFKVGDAAFDKRLSCTSAVYGGTP